MRLLRLLVNGLILVGIFVTFPIWIVPAILCAFNMDKYFLWEKDKGRRI